MNISLLGIDLAKNVFQLHGTDSGHQMRRNQKLLPHLLVCYCSIQREFSTGDKEQSSIGLSLKSRLTKFVRLVSGEIFVT